MGKFRKYIRNYIRKLLNEDDSACVPEPTIGYNPQTKASGVGRHISDGNNGMNFIVYNAIGGKVIQLTSYDPIRDRGYSSLYIVTDKEDLGQELGMIITKESLSR